MLMNYPGVSLVSLAKVKCLDLFLSSLLLRLLTKVEDIVTGIAKFSLHTETNQAENVSNNCLIVQVGGYSGDDNKFSNNWKKRPEKNSYH